MQGKLNAISVLIIVVFAIMLGGIHGAKGAITATPSAYAVKDQDGNLLTPDSESSNTYTIPWGTTLTFEVEAEIDVASSCDILVSYWPNDVMIAWWWWGEDGRNNDAPSATPEEPNTPDAPGNQRKNALFAYKETFNSSTTEPIPMNAKVSVDTPTDICETKTVTFFINVEGQVPPTLIPGPSDPNISVGLGDRVPFSLNVVDSEDDLAAIEWYLQGFELPARAHGITTLIDFLDFTNEDRFNYRFAEIGTFEVTSLAYDISGNSSAFKWNVTVQEPLLTRASPAAEVSVKAQDTATFEVLANTAINAIDGVRWNNGQGTQFDMPIESASPRERFLRFEWDASFDFGSISGFFETTEINATGYIIDESGTEVLTNNTVTWLVRGERHINSDRSLAFSGLEWMVKESNPSNARIGPGSNYFSGSTENVWVDDNGLNLKIRQDSSTDRWLTAEVFTMHSMPRGTYRFYLEGGDATRLDQLDSQVIFSPFFYVDGTREIDIEFSNWPSSDIYGEGQFQYVVQPYGNDSLERFSLDLEDSSGQITCQIDWQDDRVVFTSWLGHSATPPSPESIIENWTYADHFLPEPGDELKLHLNLWLFGGSPPTNGDSVHVVIKAIDHPVSWEAWRTAQFGERDTFISTEVSRSQGDPDLDGHLNLLEYALGSDPWKFDADRQLQFDISISDTQEPYFDYTLSRRHVTSIHPLSDSLEGVYHTPLLDYRIMSKTRLRDATWMDEPMDLVGDPVDLGDGTERVTYRTQNSIDGRLRKFFQLQVKERE